MFLCNNHIGQTMNLYCISKNKFVCPLCVKDERIHPNDTKMIDDNTIQSQLNALLQYHLKMQKIMEENIYNLQSALFIQ